MIETAKDVDCQRLYTILKSFLAGLHFDKGLDLGCGNGVIAMHSILYCDHLLAVDKVQELVDESKKKDYYGIVDFKVMNLDEDFPKGKFGLVIMGSVLQYIKNADELLNKVYKCLEDRGYILAYENMTPVIHIENDSRFEKVIICKLNREGGLWHLGLWRKK